jgi:amino acid transporter
LRHDVVNMSPVSGEPVSENAPSVKEGVHGAVLRSDALGLTSVLMQAIAHTAPATAILLTIQFTVSQAGVVGPLAYLLAFFLVLTLGFGVIQLARHLPSAGGYYTYVSRTVHPRAGFLTAWLFFLYSALTPAFSLAMMGSVLETSLRSQYGISFPWWLFLLIGTAFTAFVTYRGVEVSAAALVILGILEVGCVVLLATWGFFSPGPGGVNLSSFNPANAPSGSGLYLAIVFSIFALTGWEGAAPLAEETKDPKRIVPHAILGAVLLMGAYLVFTSWGLLVGWGTNRVADFVACPEVPAFVLARRFWGAGWILVLFALINSMVAVAVATTLVSTRMWYAMARSGSLPRQLADLHDKYKTPVNAISFQTLVTVVCGIGMGLWIGPDQEFFLMGTVLTLALAVIYSLGNLGVFLFYRKERPQEFRPVLHALFPLISSVAILWVAYKSVVPLPAAPISYAPAIVAGWFVAGVFVLIVMKLIGQEQWLLRAGSAANE